MDSRVEAAVQMAHFSVTVIEYLAIIWYLWFGLLVFLGAICLTCVVWLATRRA